MHRETVISDFGRTSPDFTNRHIPIDAAISPNARKPGDKNPVQTMVKPLAPEKYRFDSIVPPWR